MELSSTRPPHPPTPTPAMQNRRVQPAAREQCGGEGGKRTRLIARLKISSQILGYWYTPPETIRKRVSKVQRLFWLEA